MSRWDALKPVHSQRGRRKSGARGGPPQGGAASLLQHHPDPPRFSLAELALRNRDDILTQYYTLRSICDLSPTNYDSGSLIPLARLIQEHYRQIPAESNSERVVHGIFLPLLESKKADNHDELLLITLQILLQDSKHASALLASLTDHVTVTGTERRTVNPVRQRLFAVLQQRLLSSDEESSRSLESTCQCLITGLESATKVDRSSSNNKKQYQGGAPTDLDVKIISSFIEKSLGRLSTMRLLLACLRHQPSLASGLTKVLLLQDRLSPSNTERRHCCDRCGFETGNGPPLFLRLLHSEQKAAAMDCATEMLKNLPLDVWLRRETSNKIRQSAGFRHRIVDALDNILRICLCCYDHGVNDSSYMSLVKSLFTDIPYNSDPSLTKIACQLVNRVAMSTLGPSCKTQQSAKAVLIESLGGQPTPQGSLTPLSCPVGAWLDNERGQNFVDQILDHATGSSDVLCAVVRAKPEMILCDKSMWKRFQNMIQVQVNDKDFLASTRMIEAFLRGRRDSPVMEPTCETSKLLDFTLSILGSINSSDGSVAQTCTGCAAFCCLLQSDWSLLSIDEGSRHLKSITSLCSDARVKVRIQSFKTLGDICENALPGRYFGMENNFLFNFLRGMEDAASTVRCMALFAAGNLAQSANILNKLPSDLDISLCCSVAKRAFVLLDDKDHKVASNASRATSQFSCLVLREDFRTSLNANDSDFHPSDFLEQVLNSYVISLRAALSLATRTVPAQLSWKQRSGIKKLGRAACNSLGLLFERISTTGIDIADAIDCLLECIDHTTCLEEKLVMSACTALQSLDRTSLSSCFEPYDTSLGKAAVHCCGILFGSGSNSRPSNDLRLAVGSLLLHLLSCANVTNLSYLITSQRVDRNDRLTQLFRWMVANDCPHVSFKLFALALQERNVEVDIQVEQLFVNQAMGTPAAQIDDEEL